MPLEYALQSRGATTDSGPWKLPASVSLKPNASLGIADLPKLQAKLSKKRKYVFNLMVAGESGLGKTTFLNTLFNSTLTDKILPSNLNSTKTVNIVPSHYGKLLAYCRAYRGGCHFTFDSNRHTWIRFEPIINYIETQHEAYLAAEQSDKRFNIPDNRVHCLLYFLPPSGMNRIKDLDIEFLQKACKTVNVIPLIAKADSLSPDEIAEYKKTILQAFEQADIRSYPTFHTEDREFISDLEKFIPFSVIGSDKYVNVKGKMVRGRVYKWGQAEVENPAHCDFIHLRQLLINTNMQDLIDTTHLVHYANHRGAKIRGKGGRPDSFLACDELYESNIETAKKNLQDDMQKKEEAMRQRFVSKVREKEQQLREREESLNGTRHKMLEELEALRKTVESEEASYNDLITSKGKK